MEIKASFLEFEKSLIIKTVLWSFNDCDMSNPKWGLVDPAAWSWISKSGCPIAIFLVVIELIVLIKFLHIRWLMDFVVGFRFELD